MRKHSIFILLFIGLGLASCVKKVEQASLDADELAQQIGDAMSSVDEASGTPDGIFAFNQKSFNKSQASSIARLAPNGQAVDLIAKLAIPHAQAIECYDASLFSACTNNVVTRTLNNCVSGAATLNGSISLHFTDAAVDSTCSLAANGDNVRSIPSFEVKGARGSSFSVGLAPGATIGQRVTKTSATTFRYDNDGINRTFFLNNEKVFDFTTEIPADSAITVDGTQRDLRELNGGALVVTNNLDARSCRFEPVNVKWDGACSCAITGHWSGSCSDGESSVVHITGCGTADLVRGGKTTAIIFDRCYAVPAN